MGYNTAYDLANDDSLDFEQAISLHLRANHYPAIPIIMVKACIEAIKAHREEDFERTIEMPFDGEDKHGRPQRVLYKGKTEAPASALIRYANLQAWVEGESDE
jgi:hypothetical protein